jgi:hypothetical protein
VSLYGADMHTVGLEGRSSTLPMAYTQVIQFLLSAISNTKSMSQVLHFPVKSSQVKQSVPQALQVFVSSAY